MQNSPAAARPLPDPAIAINLNSMGHAINLQCLLVPHLYKNDTFTKCLLSLYFSYLRSYRFHCKFCYSSPTPMFSYLTMNIVSETRVETSYFGFF